MNNTDIYHPLTWNSYFDLLYDINLKERDITFRCYVSHNNTDNIIDNNINSNSIPQYSTATPIFVFFHGAGMGALSFSV